MMMVMDDDGYNNELIIIFTQTITKAELSPLWVFKKKINSHIYGVNENEWRQKLMMWQFCWARDGARRVSSLVVCRWC